MTVYCIVHNEQPVRRYRTVGGEEKADVYTEQPVR